MRNYVIINGINSNTIQGLAINILPPITKPLIRTQIEEIDGRDGDLVTELGYSAYDKTMEIGLWGTYDIDAIIKYFTGDGTIIFSTEPDKYYYFKILNQIDYEKLLKFKKATITFHCQPYKYPTSETPLEEAYEYVEETGTDITLDNTEETIFNKFDFIGNTYQYSTSGKNKLDGANPSEYSFATSTFSNNIITVSSTNTSTLPQARWVIDNLQANDIIRYGGIIQNSNGQIEMQYYNNNTWTTYGAGGIGYTDGITPATKSYTNTNAYSKIRILLYSSSTIPTGNSESNYKNIIVTINNNDMTYEPYTGGIASPNPDYPQDIHVVSGDNSIEVCGKNLFDKDNASIINGYIYQNKIMASGNDRITYMKVQKNTSYCFYIQHLNANYEPVTTDDINYGCFNDTPQINSTGDSSITITRTLLSDGKVTLKFTTNENTQYFAVKIANITKSDLTATLSTCQLEKGSTATTYEAYTGASYPIYLPVENLYNKDNDNHLVAYIPASGTISYGANNYFVWVKINKNSKYTIKFTQVALSTSSVADNIQIGLYENTPALNVTGTRIYTETRTSATQDYTYTYTFNSENNSYVGIKVAETTRTDLIPTLATLQINKGNPTNNYYPYGITPIELCNIPTTDYKDTFIHENNKWYKYAMIGKVVLKGGSGESWSGTTSQGFYHQEDTLIRERDYSTLMYSDYYSVGNNQIATNFLQNYAITGYYNASNYPGQNWIYIHNQDIASASDLKTWLSTHNTTVYYVLANPIQTEITDETLKSQLDDLWENAISYKGQTNITQTNNDLPFIMDVSALELGSDHLIINNTGTAFSKPTIDIEGTGIIDIYLNDEQIFEIDMTTQNEIIIDTEKMEAYTPDNLLANRLVTGDYSLFKLASGENDIRFSGDLVKATITRYIRWI